MKKLTTAESQQISVQILRSVEEKVALHSPFTEALQYAQAFLGAVDSEISNLDIQPDSFAVTFEASGRLVGYFLQLDAPIVAIPSMLPKNPAVGIVFVWHRIGQRENKFLAGERVAIWQSQNGPSFLFGEFDGEFQLVDSSLPNLAA